ncbi:peptidoglycan recognition protein family protein [Mycolicibacterium hippocampi]|nr:peptidoglycan recognition family protein [Mycolicibacterium hippocampi]
MTVHHTGSVLGDNRNAPARLLQHQKLHQNERGWSDIAYHVGVDRGGNIYELRDPQLAGDTATEYDPTGHFLVLCEGDFDQESVTREQLHGAAMAFAWAASTFSISPSVVEGHRDFASTACPGADLYGYVASGELTHLVNELMAAGPVNLQKICGPEAAERVAAIEAGG